MSIDLAAFSSLRPYLYHLTAAENLQRIKRTRSLESAAVLADQAHNPDLVGTRRRAHVVVHIDGEAIIIRDQAPLHEGNMELESGWTFEQFVRHLNQRVFFWPGNEAGPISYGRRHFSRYAPENTVIIRIPFCPLIKANPTATPLFSRCNSGSPRWSRGVAGSRGPNTFASASAAGFRAAQVVEVTFVDRVQLPDGSVWSYELAGSWNSL